MNKATLIKAIAEQASIAQKDVSSVLDTLQDVIKKAVADGDTVALQGFLTFSKKHEEAKSGVSKIGGVETPWSTPEKDVISVKISKTYKVLD